MNEPSSLSSRDYNLLVNPLPRSSPLPCSSFSLRFCLLLRMLFCISQLTGTLLPLNPQNTCFNLLSRPAHILHCVLLFWCTLYLSPYLLLRQGRCLAHCCVPCSLVPLHCVLLSLIRTGFHERGCSCLLAAYALGVQGACLILPVPGHPGRMAPSPCRWERTASPVITGPMGRGSAPHFSAGRSQSALLISRGPFGQRLSGHLGPQAPYSCRSSGVLR